MKKLFYFSAMALSVSMFIYSCEKEEIETNEPANVTKKESKDDGDVVTTKSNDAAYVYKEFPDGDWDCVSGKGLCLTPASSTTGAMGDILDDLTGAQDEEAIIEIFTQGEEDLLKIISSEEYENVIEGIYTVRMNGTIDDAKIAMIFEDSRSQIVRVYSINL
ncbi:MAG: hypothetical protein WEA99_13230 [Brumimicrobium sp.]